MKIYRKLIPASLVFGAIVAQTPPARLEFEVVSLKPVEGLIAGRPARGGGSVDGAQIHLIGNTLRSLIAVAYNVKFYQVIGPDWLDSRFDVDAKLPAGSKRSQVPEMVQSLLADRFHMKFHNESKEFPVYALLVEARGSDLKDLNLPEDDPDAPVEATGHGGPEGVGVNYSNGSAYSLAENKFDGKKLTMARMASILSCCLDRPVVDMTELKGKYDMTFAVSEEDIHGMMSRGFLNSGGSLSEEAIRNLDGLDYASLHAGLNSLGLKLAPRKAPLPVLVIDFILKTPTGN
jgi:uncharacterized protein (TIGR03435 family)